MKQNPNPLDSPALEAFVDWLYDCAQAHSLEDLKEIYRLGEQCFQAKDGSAEHVLKHANRELVHLRNLVDRLIEIPSHFLDGSCNH